MRIPILAVMALALFASGQIRAQAPKPDVSLEEKLLATLDSEDEEFGFAPDGRSVACSSHQNGNRRVALVGGKQGEEFDWVADFVFSPDGKVTAYRAGTGGSQFVVVGDRKGEAFDLVGYPHWSPDGSVVAYAGDKGKKRFVVVGDKKGEEFDEFSDPRGYCHPAFRPGGKTVAYGALLGDKRFLVLGDKRVEVLFDIVESVVFSPDGTKVAYGARKGRELWWRVMSVK